MRKARFRRRIFRSLEIAFSATRAPAANLKSVMDHGVTLGLWVSAFETLARESPRREVNFAVVRQMIEAVPWVNHDCFRLARRFEHRSAHRRKGPADPKTRPVEVYARLYRARNLALHGEALPASGVEPGRHPSRGPLAFQAAALYRSVLLWQLARNRFGDFPAAPPQRSRHTRAQWLRDFEQSARASQAHDLFEDALVKDYRNWWSGSADKPHRRRA